MGSGRGCLASDWPSTGGVLNITAAAWTAGSSDGVLATKSERKKLASTCYMLVLALCLVLFGHWCVAPALPLEVGGPVRKSPPSGLQMDPWARPHSYGEES